MDTKSKLSRACETGEVLNIRYHGGSHPGAMRQIAPIKLANMKVRARCYASNAVKFFMIDKIEIIDHSELEEHWKKGMPFTVVYSNFPQLHF